MFESIGGQTGEWSGAGTTKVNERGAKSPGYQVFKPQLLRQSSRRSVGHEHRDKQTKLLSKYENCLQSNGLVVESMAQLRVIAEEMGK